MVPCTVSDSAVQRVDNYDTLSPLLTDLDGGAEEVDVSGEHFPRWRHPCTATRGGKEV